MSRGSISLRVVQSGTHVDLLVTDVGLPGMNGRQLADAAREGRDELPVLLITGYAGTALGDTGLPPGMDVMRKPFALEALAARVGALLKPSRPGESHPEPLTDPDMILSHHPS